jgi:hypothetical protein
MRSGFVGEPSKSATAVPPRISTLSRPRSFERNAVEAGGFEAVVANRRMQAHLHRLGAPSRRARLDTRQNVCEIGLGVEGANTEQLLGLVVVRRNLVVAERPRQAPMTLVGCKLVAAEAQQRCAVPFRLAAEIEVFLGREAAARTVAPDFLALERRLVHDLGEIQRARVARERRALLEDRDAQPGARQSVRRRRAAGAGADDDRIVRSHVRHGSYPQ